MRIKRLVFKNIGPHRFLDLSFVNGLCAIVGSNGRGKSHVTDGIFSALTGNYSRFPGLKEELVSDTAPLDEESSTTLYAEHNGVEFEIYRRLRKAAEDKGRRGGRADNELRVEGKLLTRDGDIREELERRLGVNTKLISTFVFVEQREMFSFLAATPSERAVVFQMLCGTEKAEHVCKEIETFLSQISDLAADVLDNTDEINQRMAACKLELETARNTLAVDTAKLLSDEKAVQRKILQKREAYARLGLELEQVNAGITSWLSSVQVKTIAAEKAAKLLAVSDKLVAELSRQAAAARESLKSLAKAAESSRKKKKATENLASAKKLLAALQTTKPVLYVNEYESRYEISERYMLNRMIFQRNKTILDTFTAEGVVTCPTCGTLVSEMDSHLKAIREEQPKLKAAELADKALLDAIDSSHAAVTAYAAKFSEFTLAADIANAELAAIGDIPAVVEDSANLQDVVAKYEQASAANKSLASNKVTAAADLVAAQTRLKSAQELVEKLTVNLAANTVSDVLLAKAVAALKRHDDARVAVAVAKQQVATLTSEIVRYKEELAAVQTRLARGRKGKLFVEKLQQIRGVMHRQKLPQVVAQANLADMEQDINQRLEGFGSPYWVEAAEDLTFTVHPPGGPPRSAQRLSVGQKAVLAFSFRLALQRTFGAETGLLVLDEPSDGLDDSNVRLLTASLSNYASQVRDRYQVIIITHARETIPAFDQCVDLDTLAN